MKDKAALVILGTLLAGAVGVPLLLLRKKAAAPVSITILDAQGKPVQQVPSPVLLVQDVTYTFRITARNTSTSPATLGVGLSLVTLVSKYEPPLVPVKRATFAANETKVFDFPRTHQAGIAGFPGKMTAWVEDPTGTKIASVSGSFLVVPPGVVRIDGLLFEVQTWGYPWWQPPIRDPGFYIAVRWRGLWVIPSGSYTTTLSLYGTGFEKLSVTKTWQVPSAQIPAGASGMSYWHGPFLFVGTYRLSLDVLIKRDGAILLDAKDFKRITATPPF